MQSSRDGEFRRLVVEEIGSSADVKFTRWGVQGWDFQRCEFTKWGVQKISFYEMGSSGDGEVARWGVQQMGSSRDRKFIR